MDGRDILAESGLFTYQHERDVRTWAQHKTVSTRPMLYCRYDCQSSQCTLLIGDHAPLFHAVREIASSSRAGNGITDPFIFIVSYLDRVLDATNNYLSAARNSLSGDVSRP